MAGNIRITPDTMRQRATEYRTEATNVENVISNMDRLLGELRGEWEGAASEAYAARFEELRPGFVKAKELILEIADALTNAAASLENADTDLASSLSSN